MNGKSSQSNDMKSKIEVLPRKKKRGESVKREVIVWERTYVDRDRALWDGRSYAFIKITTVRALPFGIDNFQEIGLALPPRVCSSSIQDKSCFFLRAVMTVISLSFILSLLPICTDKSHKNRF